jgi:hypothetical protein
VNALLGIEGEAERGTRVRLAHGLEPRALQLAFELGGGALELDK